MSNTYTAQENLETKPVLILDRVGFWGEFVADTVREFTQVVLVGPEENESSTNPLFVKFKENIPQIPSDTYSHIIVFWEDHHLTKELLQACLTKARQDKARIVIVFEKKNWDAREAFNASQAGASIAVFGDVFGTNRADKTHVPLDVLIARAKSQKKITIENAGLTPIYPVSFLDTMKLLLNMTFGEAEQDVMLLYAPYPLTILRFAHAIVKIDPEVALQLGDGGKQFASEDIEGKHVLPSGYDPFTHFPEVYEKTTAEEIAGIIAEEKAQQVPVVAQKTFSFIKWLALSGVYVVLLLFCVPAVLVALGAWQLKSAATDISQGHVTNAAQKAQFASTVFGIFQKTNPPFLLVISPVLPENTLSLLQSAPALSDDIQDIVQAVATKNAQQLSLSNITSLTTPLTHIFSVLLETGQIDYFNRFSLTAQDISSGLTFVRIAPEILGLDGTRTYLVLLQNNAELRPGGGFIGSYGELTIARGVEKSFIVHDVYDADGQLKGHREPPFALRRYLPQVHWYLRDSNWSPDFPTNALAAQSFLLDEMHTTYDGVIGVDLYFVQGLLKATGPVYVSDYQETVSADNFFSETEKHAEQNFFAGSTQKKDFLSSVVNVLSEQLTSHVNTVGLIKAVLSGLYGKHLMISVNNAPVENILVSGGFAGSTWDGRITGADQLNDTLGIIEANLGVNKANAFVTRNASHSVHISTDGTVAEEVMMQITNNSKKGQWPGGPYKDYLRFFVPTQTNLVSISLDGSNQALVPAVIDPTKYEATSFVSPTGLEIETATESGKTAFGFLVTVPESSTHTIDVKYTLGQKVNPQLATYNYSLRIWHQAGIETVPYNLTITADSQWQIIKNSDGNRNITTLTFDKNLTQDTTIDMTLSKQ